MTRAEFARAAAREASELRVRRLTRMSDRELRALLVGDPAEAAVWVRSAAEYGMAAAQLRLGRMLLEGTGVQRDEAQALSWFVRAAERGSAEASNMVGRCYENGWGVAVDLQLAAEHYRRSAEARHDWGQYNFGHMLFDGRGTPPDRPQALRWYLGAAQQGHGRAMNLIGRCLEEGWGCRQSHVDAVYWYRRSAESGYFRGQFNYASALLEQRRATLAAEWFWRSAVGGNVEIRRAITATLRCTTDPALAQLAARVGELGGGGTREARASLQR
jgi:uncharacterized protein